MIQVLDAVNQKGQHAIIFGDRGVGKTSLANVLSAFLPPGGNVLAVRVNCDAGDTFDSLWRKVFSEVQSNEHTEIGGFRTSSQPARLDANEDFVTPETVRRQLLRWAPKTTLLIVIDEFDRMDDRYRAIFADTIKTLSDRAVAGTVVLVGVADSVDQLISQHESIQRALVQVKMPRMSQDEVKEIITKGITALGMKIEPIALNRISVLAQGLPHYAHLLGLHASRSALMNGSMTITPGLLEQGVRKAIQGAQQSIRSAAHKATISPRKDNLFAQVLLACALAKTDEMGTFAAQDVRGPMQMITGKPYDIPSFAQHLNEFSDAKRGNILKKTGASRRFRYSFSNPLMQPFVIMTGFADGKIPEGVLDALVSAPASHKH
jgi:Cdc6-like AAA superfamily ATPase